MAHFERSSALLGTLLILQGGLTPLALAEVIVDTAPSIVERLEALPSDGEVTLTWDAATDDTGVEGYYVYTGLKSVAENGGSYTLGSSDAGNTTSYVMDQLTNGVTYYFAVKAYDAEGNESADYSGEVEATPESSETGDFTAPTVDHVSAQSSTLVEVSFSEPVVLPEEGASAFTLEASDGTAIEILDAYLTEDPSTVYVVTDVQVAGAMYTLTASAIITDSAGNPISSGTSDTGVFVGSSLERTTETTSTETSVDTSFQVESLDASESNELVLHFSQEVMAAAPSAFTIQLADDASIYVEVLAVSVDSENPADVTLVTEDMAAGYDYVLTMDDSILNLEGAALAEDAQTVEFTAKTLELADVVAPEDVTDFLASITNESSVVLSWAASANSAGDLAKYLVYQSSNGGSMFGDALTLAPDVTRTDVTGLTPGATYTFKVTAVDESGNESEGVLTTVTLPEAGPALFMLVPMALAGAAALRRRRRD